jgi:hypothetical protein
MSTPQPLLSAPTGGSHPARLSVRHRELAITALAGGVALAVALAVTVAMPKPNYALVLGAILGVIAVGTLVSYGRLEVSVSVLALYVGLIEGPLKLIIYSQAVSAVRDVLIGAVATGALMRIWESGRRVRLPPLSGWVLAFVALVLVEAFNPNTLGITKAIGGFRQQLEWVPFFFFGYALMRSRERLRKLFVILGVIALANGLISTYQTRLSPGQLASWGPGYAELIHGSSENGSGKLTGREYVSEGVAHVRPPGLGSDAGFGGGVGVLALAGALALLATSPRRRRWIALLLCLGALLAVVTALARLSAVGAGIGVVAFVALSLSAGKRVSGPLGALVAVAVLALPLGAVLVASEGQGIFSRYESIVPTKVVNTSTSYKEVSLDQIPHDISAAPFGFGLATAGAASAFGGRSSVSLEGHGFSAETEFNFITDELGLPGLVLWVAISLLVIALAVRGLPRVKDVDARILLAGMFAAYIAFTIMSFDGPVTAGGAFGPYFWFAFGTAAYWFAGPGRRADAHGRVVEA